MNDKKACSLLLGLLYLYQKFTFSTNSLMVQFIENCENTTVQCQVANSERNGSALNSSMNDFYNINIHNACHILFQQSLSQKMEL